MPTPKQPQTTIETEFGPAKIVDFRDHTKPDETPVIYFDKLTINRVEYKDIGVSLYKRDGEVRAITRSHIRKSTTDAADRKLHAALLKPELLKVYEPFLDTLDADSIRASVKHRIAHEILWAIGKEASNRFYPTPEGNARDGLIDEVLVEIVEARTKGTHFSNINL